VSKELMYRDEIQQLVSEAYRAVDAPQGAGARFYTEDQLALVPAGARNWMLGVGNPLAWVALQPGEVVCDLGCGAGVDTQLAARQVGTGGRAVGVDFLPEMLERARAFAGQAGVANVEFLHGEMEAVPLPDASVDAVISNGSVNLSARKSRVFAEAHRILRPGGRLCVTDFTIREEDLPAEILTHPAAWAG
jgi:arsenite methyltransferase